MKRVALAFLLAALLALSGCGSGENTQGDAAGGSTSLSSTAQDSSSQGSGPEQQTEEVPSASGEIFAMDTYMTVNCYGDRCQEALQASLEEIQRLDTLLSVGLESSEISQINAEKQGTVSEDSAAMIPMALELYRTTDGAFDITVYPLMELWGFTTGEFAVPAPEALQALLAEMGSDRLAYNENSSMLTLGEGQGIDLGGIAKGYTSGRLMEIFQEYELVSGYVSLGGNVQCYRTKPDGSLWRCGIQNPFKPEDGSSFLGILSVADRAVITSGAYERYFVDEETGETYHHILNPETGYPAQSGLSSVTIVSENGTLADGLSTACYVMGKDKAISYWQTFGDDFDMVLMTEDGEVYVTEPIAADFCSDFTVHVIEQEG